MAKDRIRVLIAKPGLDGHWRGAIIVSMALRDAGMEVIFTGNQSPGEIVEAVLQEDVDVLGLSLLAANHLRLIPEVIRTLQEKGGRNILVIVGGTIPPQDIPQLKEAGVDEVFIPGTKLQAIVNYIQQNVGLNGAL